MRTSLVMFVLAALLLGPSVALAADDVDAIRQVIKLQWDKPEAPVVVGPVVIEGSDAIAGWTQEKRGGRALLRRSKAGWKVVLCGGDALKGADALEQTGIAKVDADALAAKLAAAEAAMPPERVALFSTFEGLVQMDREDSPHAHY